MKSQRLSEGYWRILTRQFRSSRIAVAAFGIMLAFFAIAAAGAPKLKVALSFDDLPLNGTLPTGAKQSDFARDTIKVLKKHRSLQQVRRAGAVAAGDDGESRP